MTPKKICAGHEIAVKPRVETLDSAEWRLNRLGTGEKNMTPSELRKAADYLESLHQDFAASDLREHARQLECDAQAEQIERVTLERMDVPITVNAGDIAAALHWIEDHAWLSDTPVPNAVLELRVQLANVHVELIGEFA